MAFITITPAMTDQFISALCNTLVHSLWQGLLLSVVTGFIILFTRKANSATRYNLLIGSLLLFAVGVGVTFAMQFKQVQVVAATQLQASQNLTAQSIVNNVSIAPIQTKGLTDNLFDYLNSHHNTIVLIWFLIICAKSVQLAIGLIGIRRLKTVKVNAANSYWTTKMNHLANLIDVKQSVRLLESGLAKIPMAIGHLKPVILIPIGLFTALSTEEVEAILIHELAHIKRRDYLVNLLQSLMEIVFFFNPAVLWVSQLIKTERENCCDDMAVSQSSNKVNYIRALVSCQEYQQTSPAYAMAFPGGKDSLIDRVKRMASNRNHSLNVFEKTILAVCLVASGLCFSAFSQKEHIKQVANTVVNVIHHIEINHVEEHQIIKQTDALKHQTALIKKATVQLGVADKSPDLSAESHPYYTPVQDYSSPLSPLNGQLDSTKECVTPFEVRLGKLNPLSTVNFKTNAAVNLKSDVVVNLDTNKKATIYNYTTALKSTDYKPVTINNTMVYKADSIQARVKLKLSPVKLNSKLALPVIGDELYNAHLITDKQNYKAILNNHELIVNSVKQSEENHQLILKKYMKSPDDKVDLNFVQINKNN